MRSKRGRNDIRREKQSQTIGWKGSRQRERKNVTRTNRKNQIIMEAARKTTPKHVL